jgi:hypothetical protein
VKNSLHTIKNKMLKSKLFSFTTKVSSRKSKPVKSSKEIGIPPKEIEEEKANIHENLRRRGNMHSV